MTMSRPRTICSVRDDTWPLDCVATSHSQPCILSSFGVNSSRFKHSSTALESSDTVGKPGSQDCVDALNVRRQAPSILSCDRSWHNCESWEKGTGKPISPKSKYYEVLQCQNGRLARSKPSAASKSANNRGAVAKSSWLSGCLLIRFPVSPAQPFSPIGAAEPTPVYRESLDAEDR
jgi:hypothetical protein